MRTSEDVIVYYIVSHFLTSFKTLSAEIPIVLLRIRLFVKIFGLEIFEYHSNIIAYIGKLNAI